MSEPIRDSAVDTISPAARVDSGIDVGDEPLPIRSHVEFVSPAARVDSGIDTGDEPPPPSQAEVIEPPAPSQPEVVEPPAPSQPEVVEPPAPSQPEVVEPPAPSQPDTIEPDAKGESGVDVLEPLTRVDSAVQGLSSSPPKEKADKASSRRKSSMVAGVASIKELWESETPIQIAKQTQKSGWKINASPTTVDEKEILKIHLVTPPVRAIDLEFGVGIHTTIRNRTGVTIKDAMDAIFKYNKKKADDELDKPYLAGFEWVPSWKKEYTEEELANDEKEKDWKQLLVHLDVNPGVSHSGGGKKKKNKGGD